VHVEHEVKFVPGELFAVLQLDPNVTVLANDAESKL